MKMRELFSPIPKEIFRKDDVRERVEIFLVLFVVAGLGYKFVKGSINDYLSLDDPDVALAVFVNAAIAAAFLLAALGADRETIMADYEISNDYYHDITTRIIQEVRARGGNDDAVAVIQTFIGVNPEYFSGALDLIDKKYGSMQNYLTNQLLLSEEDMARLRDRLLE